MKRQMLQQNKDPCVKLSKEWKTTTYHTEIKADSNDFDNANANDDDRPII
jgi:hypothetical protein